MKTKTVWRCEFKFQNEQRSVDSEDDGIFAFKEGFWINEDMQFTKGSDGKYWIPPSKIDYIAKDERKVYE